MQQIRKKMVLGIAIRVGRGERGAKWKVEFPEPAQMIGCLTKKTLDHDHASAEQRFERWLRLCSHVIMLGQVHEAHIKEG